MIWLSIKETWYCIKGEDCTPSCSKTCKSKIWNVKISSLPPGPSYIPMRSRRGIQGGTAHFPLQFSFLLSYRPAKCNLLRREGTLGEKGINIIFILASFHKQLLFPQYSFENQLEKNSYWIKMKINQSEKKTTLQKFCQRKRTKAGKIRNEERRSEEKQGQRRKPWEASGGHEKY